MQSFVASDGCRLAYDADDFTDPWRTAETILLLHSAMGCVRRWYAWVPRLARRYRVVALDLRGHGASAVPPPDPPLTMDRLVADVRELLDHLGIGAAHVVGNSAGGYIGQNLAMASPDRVKSLMLFGSTPGLKRTQAATWLPQVAAKGLKAFIAETIEDRLDPGTTDPGLVRWFIDQVGENDVPFIGRFIGLMTTLDWTDRLHRIACPTLVVYPGAETVGSVSLYDDMKARIPDVEMRVYEGLPHNICDAAPERCADDVLDFLKRRFGSEG